MIRLVLGWYISICATLVLIIQGLSTLHAIALGPLLLSIAAVALVALLIKRPRLAIPSKFIWPRPQLLHPSTLPFLIGLPVIATVSFALGWHMPPNNWDSMTYHLSRAAYWRQWHTLAHFPTNNVRQDAFPGNAEVLLLVTLLVAHSAKIAFLVQFTAYLAATVAVYGLGRQIGLRPAYAFVGAGAFATMPEVVLQSTSAQNDLVVAAFIVSAAYFFVDAVQQRRGRSLLLAGMAVGLAVGTKPTAVLVLPGLGLGAVALIWPLCRTRYINRRITVTIAGALLAVILLGSPWYIANKTYFGRFSGPPAVAQTQGVLHPSLDTLRMNVLRYLVAFIDPEGPLPANAAASATICDQTNALRATIASAANITSFEPAIEWPGAGYSPIQACVFNEDTSWFGLTGFVSIIIALIYVVRGIAYRRIGVGWLLAAGALSSLICASLLLRWSPWQGRLLIATIALSAPLLGLLGERLIARRWSRLALNVLVLYATATGCEAAINNVAKPLTLWNANAATVQTIMRPEMGPVLEQIARTVPEGARLGVFLNGDDWDFPLFGSHLNRFIEPLVPSGTTSHNGPLGTLQYVLTHQSARATSSLFASMHLTHCRRTWATETVSTATVPWRLYDCGRIRHMNSGAQKSSVGRKEL